MTHLGYLLWTVWAAHLVPMFFGIGMGATKEQKAAQRGLQDIANYGTATGEKATNEATGFWSDILSGDIGKIMRVLGPQITTINDQGQQVKQTASQFGNRSGGTNATLQMVDDRTRAAVDNLIAGLTGAAATNLGNEGLTLLNTGVRAGEGSFNAASVIQKANAAKWGDLFKSIASVAGAFLVPGAGAAGALPQVAGGVSEGTIPSILDVGGNIPQQLQGLRI